MFGFLKKKLQDAVSKFSKNVEDEVEVEEVTKKVDETKAEKKKEEKKKDKPKKEEKKKEEKPKLKKEPEEKKEEKQEKPEKEPEEKKSFLSKIFGKKEEDAEEEIIPKEKKKEVKPKAKKEEKPKTPEPKVEKAEEKKVEAKKEEKKEPEKVKEAVKEEPEPEKKEKKKETDAKKEEKKTEEKEPEPVKEEAEEKKEPLKEEKEEIEEVEEEPEIEPEEEPKPEVKEEIVEPEESEEKIKGVKITYFVHGTTTDNEEGLATGHEHGELSELGITQAKELANQVDVEKFDVMFTSDLKRATDSADFGFKDKLKIIKDKRLREVDYGEFTLKPCKEFKPNMADYVDERFPSGESYRDVEKRIAEFLNDILKKYQGKHIAIMAHHAPQLAIEVLVEGKTWEQAIADDWRPKNAWQPGWDYSMEAEVDVPEIEDTAAEAAEVQEEAPEQQEKKSFLSKIFHRKKEEEVIEEKEEVEEEKEAEPEPEVPEELEEIKEDIKDVEKEKEVIEEEEKVEEPKKEKKEEVEEEPEISEEPIKEEEPEEEPAEEAKPKKKGLFSFVTERVTKFNISEEKFEEMFWDLEVALLENNVAVEVIEKIKEDMKEELTREKISRKKVMEVIINRLDQSIKELFDVDQIDLMKEIKKKKPFVISFIGVNGSGKTTSMAKVAKNLMNQGLSVVFAAADTFRAAAIEQLQEHADKLGVKMIRHDYKSDPAAVAFDAVEHAKAKNIDVVLVDTAGRLHSNDNLMNELKKLVRVNNPDLKVFVGESTTGNDCVEQARLFDQAVGIDAVILAKVDVDDKGGAAISISFVTKKPIIFIGTGQNYEDLEPFDPQIVLKSLGLEA